MNRIIKFRAWYCGAMVNNVGFHPHICMKHPDYKADEDCAYTLSPDFDSVNLMQFTGLLDKNGTEIYEGDILRCRGGEQAQGYSEWDVTGVVTYSKSASFDVVCKDDIYHSFGYSDWDSIEVIGNIYSNPELI